MPVIQRFDGFAVKMYFADHNPPHVHVVGADFEATVAIGTAQILEGAMPARVSRVVLPWIEDNRADLLVRWRECQ
jgi:hypothetical protein